MSDRGIHRRRTNIDWTLAYPISAGPERISFALADEFDFDNPEARAFRHGRESCRQGLDKFRSNTHGNPRCRHAFSRGYAFQQRLMKKEEFA